MTRNAMNALVAATLILAPTASCDKDPPPAPPRLDKFLKKAKSKPALDRNDPVFNRCKPLIDHYLRCEKVGAMHPRFASRFRISMRDCMRNLKDAEVRPIYEKKLACMKLPDCKQFLACRWKLFKQAGEIYYKREMKKRGRTLP